MSATAAVTALFLLFPNTVPNAAAELVEKLAAEGPKATPRLIWGDFDGDGLADALGIYPLGDTRLFRNSGDGTFVDVTDASGLPSHVRSGSASWADYDRDGKLDLYLSAERVDQRLFHNLGSGRFEDATATTGLDPIGGERTAIWMDLDNDGLPDLLIASAEGDHVLHNAGGQSFEHVNFDAVFEPPVIIEPGEAGIEPSASATDQPSDDSPHTRGERRQQRSARASSAVPVSSNGNSLTFAPQPNAAPIAPITNCSTLALRDQATGNTCLQASTTPTLGMLFPLSPAWNVSPSGDIGIGTATPVAKVHVQAANAFARLLLHASGSQYGESNLSFATAGDPYGWQLYMDDYNLDDLPAATSLGFWHQNLGTAMVLDIAGNVGIGTTNPASRLHVVGNQGQILVGSSVASGRIDFARGSDGLAATTMGWLSPTDNTTFKIANASVFGVLRLESTATTFNSPVGGPELMRVASNGNVGIGTTNPSQKLEVVGDARVSNRITAYQGIFGAGCSAAGSYSTVSGGQANEASGFHSTVSGGQGHQASGAHSTISGGIGSTATGDYATVAGGMFNFATGRGSFAAGTVAQAAHDGSFVWADTSGNSKLSSADNQFNIYASGGTRIFSSGAVNGVMLAPGAGSWSSMSDRAAKENLASVDAQEILDRVCGLPITTWNYNTQNDSIRHMGPMAQDFHAAFGLGVSDKTIDTVDPDGVALAAIQGLSSRMKEAAAIEGAEVAELRAANFALTVRVARLESIEADVASLKGSLQALLGQR